MSFEDLGLGSDEVKELVSFEEKTQGVKFADDVVEKLRKGTGK